jgi:hypothetical protein
VARTSFLRAKQSTTMGIDFLSWLGQRGLQALRRLLLDDHLDLPWRIAGAFVLLFGQPAERIAGMTIGQVKVESDEPVLLNPAEGLDRRRRASGHAPAHLPLDTLLHTYLGSRRNMATAANPDSAWLFPGGMPGRHIDAAHIANKLRAAGVPVLAARMGTWRQLVREAPPSILAAALGSPPSLP